MPTNKNITHAEVWGYSLLKMRNSCLIVPRVSQQAQVPCMVPPIRLVLQWTAMSHHCGHLDPVLLLLMVISHLGGRWTCRTPTSLWKFVSLAEKTAVVRLINTNRCQMHFALKRRVILMKITFSIFLFSNHNTNIEGRSYVGLQWFFLTALELVRKLIFNYLAQSLSHEPWRFEGNYRQILMIFWDLLITLLPKLTEWWYNKW